MGTKTIMYDRVVPPGGEFRPRTRVRVRLVAADSGEGTGYNSADRRTIIGVADELLDSELFVVDLDAQASITAPAVTAYEITRVYPGWPAPPAETFTAPAEPTPTATTQEVTLPAANIAASTSGFASSGAIYLDGQLVTYTGTTPTAFTGCTGGTGLVGSGSAVRQAHWIPDFLVNPPVGLPNLHVDDAIGAHAASAVAVAPTGGLVATDAQAALAELDSELAAEAALARNADNLTSGTVADARIAASIARDSEVTAAVAAEAALRETGDTTRAANQQVANYTLVLSDAGKAVEGNAAGALNFTVPPNSSVAYPTGTIIEVVQVGAGAVTLVQGSGVTITGDTATPGEGGSLLLRKTGTNAWFSAIASVRSGTYADSPTPGTARTAVVAEAVDQEIAGIKSVDVPIRIKTERFDIRHPDWGGSLDGVANNVTAINAIQASSLSASGGELYFGPGVAGIGGSGVLLTRGNMTWKGAGMWVSTIKALAGATAMIGSSAAGTLAFEDLAFDGSDLLAILLNLGGNRHQRVTFRRCRFFGLGDGIAIVAAQAAGYEFYDCIAHAPGTGNGRFVSFQTGGGKHKVVNCTARYLKEGIIVATGNSNWENGRQDFLTIQDFDIDLGWWLLKAAFSGSGGTVTYANPSGTQVVITDTAAALTGITTSAGSETNIRVMPVRSTGTHNAVNSFITGTGFTAAGIKRGDIVRCGTAFAVVMSVESDTSVRIEEWLDQTTYLPVAPPTTGTAWTVYGSLIGRVTAFTGTTVTIDRLHDVDGTTVLLPAAGTRYEVMNNRPNYPFQAERGAYGVRVRGGLFRRGWSDQIAFQGARNCSVTGATVADGQDMGLTLDTNSEDCSVQDTWAIHNGAGGIYARGAYHQIVNNRAQDNHWQNSGNLLGDFNIIALTGGVVAQNIARRRTSTMALATYGFISRAGGAGALIARNQAEGHATAGFRMESDSGAHKWRDNDGTYSIAGTVAHTFGTQEGTGSPEAVVFGSIGDTYRRRDGGAGTSTYVKESGNGTTTGWVAK